MCARGPPTLHARLQTVIDMFTALLERSFAATLSVLRKKISMLAIVITPERVATRDLSCMKGPWNGRNQGVARRTGPAGSGQKIHGESGQSA